IFWSTGYDTIYALMDREEDRKIGVKSTAILFGDHVFIITSFIFSGVILILVGVGLLVSMGVIYYLSLAIAMFLFSYQVFMVKRSPDRETAFLAFVSNVVIGGIILFGISLDLNL
ncbi:MAG: UbiA family prenyltransferase, partial [Thermodesulfobacteriota bacterium]